MHFLSKLHNNSILTGLVDSYCLVCDNYLRSEDEAFTHTEKPIHKKNMGMAVRVEKFYDDRIIKVKKGYFCPFCNTLLSTTTKVSIHISDANHKENKKSQVLSKLGDYVTAFDEIAITSDSWHGIMETTCVICNLEFDTYDAHSKDGGHVLKLIQSKCEFGDKYVYRKVDEDSFFCLICGSVFAINDKPNHHENNSHINLYNSGKTLKTKIQPITQVPSDNESKSASLPEQVNTESVNTETRRPENKKDSKPAPPKQENSLPKEPKNDSEVDMVTFRQIVKESGFDVDNYHSLDSVDPKYANIKDAFKNIADKAGFEIVNFQISDTVNTAKKTENFDDKKTNKAESKIAKPAANYTQGSIKESSNKMSEAKIVKEEKETIKLVTKISDNNKMTEKITLNKPVDTTKNTIEDEKLESNMLDRVEEFQKKGIHVDFTSEKARCKQCNESVPFDTAAVEKHIEMHNIKINVNNDSKTDLKKKLNNTKEKPLKKLDESPDNSNQKSIIKLDSAIDVQSNIPTNKKAKKSDNSTEKQQKKLDNTTEKQSKKGDSNKLKSDKKKELETLAQKNNMVILPNEAFCPLCKIEINLNIVAMTAHINLTSHKNKVLSENISPLGKKISLEYMESVVSLESNLGTDVVLNNKYLLKQNGFHCIVMNDVSFVCMLCLMTFTKSGEKLMQHINDPEHKTKLSLSMVVTSMPEELIREIRPDEYHCGFCNEVYYSMAELEEHLKTYSHFVASMQAKWNLERCHASIKIASVMKVSSMRAINYM